MSRAEQLKKRQAKDLEQAELEDRIETELPEGYPWKIHGHKLYGSIASVEIKHGRTPTYGNTEPQYNPSLDDVLALAEALPALSMMLVKDGCTSFRPLDHVARLQSAGKLERADLTHIAPFRWDVELFQTQTVTIGWYARIPSGVVRVQVVMLISKGGLGSAHITYRTKNGRGREGNHIKTCDYHPPTGINSLAAEPYPNGSADGIASLDRVKWASGGPEYPSKFTLYWLPLGENRATIADLVRNLRADAEGDAA